MIFKLKNSYYRWIVTILIGIGYFLVGMNNSYAARINASINEGFIPVGSFSGSVTVPANTYLNESDSLYSGFAFALTSMGGGICSSNQSNWKTIDGYYGYELETGILLIIYDTNITGSVISSSHGTVAVNGTFNRYGVLSGSIPPKTNSENCYSYLTESFRTPSKTTIQINGQYGYYISSRAVAGSFSLQRIGLRRAQGQGTNGDYININASDLLTVTYIPPLNCSISAPPTINFGIINGFNTKSDEYLAQQTGDLNINCFSDDPNRVANVKIQVIGKAENWPNILTLRNEENNISAGEIRGWIRPQGDLSCSGSSGTNTMYFSSPDRWIDGGKIKNGINLIPYVFYLCGSGNNKANNLGRASATATINLLWN
ncbi:MAG TPA: hypothetical protein DD649_15545 [Providencia sp.]|uniref:hypothetical protein n=1 Tax=Providencia sp. TaxID=589 RepID=UPI000E8FD590|nr:hypothetical protein [Providencia sp.]MBP6081000.1 hypothetical protein [Providencia sp.]HBO24282.1 hypothetical protein [Providencia sp.]